MIAYQWLVVALGIIEFLLRVLCNLICYLSLVSLMANVVYILEVLDLLLLVVC